MEKNELRVAESVGSLEVRPDPEVRGDVPRRKFTAQYKLDILRKVEACQEPGEIGSLLRREGLYSSNLTTWKRQRETGVLAAL
jgi:transposase-like protein